MKMNVKRSVFTAGLSAAVTAAALGLGGCGAGAQMLDTIKVQNVNQVSDTITVTGKEEVKVVPDMAEIVYSVHTQADTAAQCQSDNAGNLDAAIEKLKSLGVEEKSIQTTSYGLNPIYDWKSSDQKVTGYEMTTRLTVSDIPIDQTGTILTESVAVGVNEIDSVTYFASSYDASYQEALKGAMAVARAKADALAEASGKTVGSVSHVEEYGYDPGVRYSSYNASGARAEAGVMEAKAADMAVMPGEVSVEAQVKVDYTIQ